MCLYATRSRVLKEDLEVYKFQIMHVEGSEQQWVSPVEFHKPEYNKISTAVITISSYKNPEEEFKKSGEASFGPGYFHTYTKIPSKYRWHWSYGARVIKCIIPAGEKIFLDEDCKEIASKRLIFTEEEVKKWKW
jgi:hypothetical protein